MRVSKVKLFEETMTEACGGLGGETSAIRSGFFVVLSVGDTDGLVFTFGFVSDGTAPTGAAGSPQIVCCGATGENALGGLGGW